MKAEHRFYAFCSENQPALRVHQGEELLIETQDCFGNRIRHEDELFSAADREHPNPATGPIFVIGAEPGDILVADILRITPLGDGVMMVVPGEGAVGKQIMEAQTKIVPMERGLAVFTDAVQVPVCPMIGTIGTAPRQGAIANGTPGAHGGNMDCAIVGEGSKVYLPVEVPGALFGLGDLHAVQGDGEVGGFGLEIAGEVRLRLTLLKEVRLPLPLVETSKSVATVYSDEDLDAAAQGAIDNMYSLLTEQVGISLNETGMLMSILGWVQICQVVNDVKTCRMEIPKWLLLQYGFEMARMK